nr:hypothetical protein [Tanacetum cinerariifolium]
MEFHIHSIPCDLQETTTTVNQRISIEEIEQVIAQRVANVIEAIAIYETKTNLAHKSMSQTERKEEEVVENASNKRRWESNHNGSLSQQNKGHKETMTTVNQGMSVEEIEQVVAQRVTNAIEAIAIYETKTNLAHESMSQTERQKEKVAENASNKRKWESNHNGSLSQQNKGHKVPRAHTAWPINKKAYAGSLSLCNQCKFHHSGPCTKTSPSLQIIKRLMVDFFAFGGSPKGGKITGKGIIKTGKLDFEDLLDENQVLLKVPRQNNMYSFDLKNFAPSGGLTCLFAKATIDESNLWHRRLGHINFKTMNKIVKGNLVRGLPSKIFENNHTCVACQKGKQHKASYRLGKFEGKADEGFLVGYFVNITTGNQINDDVGIEIIINAGQAGLEKASDHEYILLLFMPSNSPLSSSTQRSDDKDVDEVPGKGDEGVSKGSEINDQERTNSSTQDVNTARPSTNTGRGLNINIVGSND